MGKSWTTQAEEGDDSTWEGFQDGANGTISAPKEETQEGTNDGVKHVAGVAKRMLKSGRKKDATLKEDSMKNRNVFEALHDTAKDEINGMS